MAAADDQKPAKLEDTSFGASRGLAEAIAQLDPAKYPPYKGLSPLGKVERYFSRAAISMAYSLDQLEVTAENMTALVTAVPLVARLRIGRALDTIASVPEGKMLVDMLQDSGLPVKMRNDFGYNGAVLHTWVSSREGAVKQEAYEIVVPAFSTHGRLVAYLTHELQHLNQSKNNILMIGQNKVVSPLETIWHNAAVEADAQATAVDVAYKLKQAGKPEAWDELCLERSTSKNFTADYAAAVQKDPAAAQNGQAKRAAYDAWFEATFKDGQKLSDFYAMKGFMNYGVAHNAMKSENFATPMGAMTTEDIRKLGALSAVNYMDAPGGRPLDDPYYRDLPPMNARHAEVIGESHRSYQSKFFDTLKAPVTHAAPAVVAAVQIQAAEPAPRPATPQQPQQVQAFKPPRPA